ncbi:MAG: SDR family oxidoreductase [Clostridiales Family XIII bacterium]|jgi:NAD(P)-dependent dehydrogenase (short-subunit alcohol dehydrogenase family)|nr:SDR family oxidoreductase [Clostridiales Family XIII bacterium]
MDNTNRKNSDRTILVTGASSGIGAAVAELLLSEGYRVVATSRDGGALGGLYGGDSNAVCVPWDLSDIGRIKEYAAEVNRAAGAVSGLVHCAGAQDVMPLHLTKPELLERVFGLNSFAAILLAAAFARKGMYAESASFVLVSSLSAHEGARGRSVYAASKAALEGFTVAVSPELSDKGIRVNCVAPGIVETQSVKGFLSQLSAEQKESLLGGYPLGIGKPNDVAGLIEFLVSDKSRWISGNVFTPDGGHLAR